jgi:hypothetical protein
MAGRAAQFLRREHKDGQDAWGQQRYCLANQALGIGRTRMVSFHKTGQLAAQKQSSWWPQKWS